MKNLLFFITIILFFSCEQNHKNDSLNKDGVFINHQIIIDNPENVSGSFYLYSSAGHNYSINESDSVNIINGTFGTTLKNWSEDSMNYMVIFYYTGGVGFGCINIEINTFKDFELYHTNDFVLGESANNSFCAWNENSFQYSISIND